MKRLGSFPVMPDLYDAQIPKRGGEDGGMDVPVRVKPLEAAPIGYDPRSDDHLAGGELVLMQWDSVVQKGVDMRLRGILGFEDGVQPP
jgi:hypothetical protein